MADNKIPTPDPEETKAFVESSGKSEKALEKDFRIFRAKAMKLAHGEETRDNILQALGQGNPIESLANVTFTIADRVGTAMRQSGAETPDQVLAAATLDVMAQIAEVSEAAGIHEYTPEELQASFSEVVNRYFQKEMREGRVDREELAMSLGREVKRLNPKGRELLNEQLKAINAAATGSKGQEQERIMGMAPQTPQQPQAPGLLAQGAPPIQGGQV